MDVIVEYDYTAQEPDELTIKKGDIIKDVIKQPGGWWEGSLNDKKGMFPDNFVRSLDKEPSIATLRSKKDVARIRQCRVVFSYVQNHEDELSLKVGEVIDIIGDEEEGWWRGILHGKEGVFPSNFVEEITKPKPSSRESAGSELAASLPPNQFGSNVGNISLLNKVDTTITEGLFLQIHQTVTFFDSAKQLCEVKYAYKAQNEDELTLAEGEIITLISKDGQDQGWWKGELNGKTGVFPDNFVVLINSIDERLSKEDKKVLRNDIPGSVIKPSSQRKSLEVKPDRSSTGSTDSKSSAPPVVGKKPIISIKKSPSGSGGIFSEIKKKLADVVDGASVSKSTKTEMSVTSSSTSSSTTIETYSRIESFSKIESNNNESFENNVFDQVERRPLLRDVRANRAKAPGRRLPTSIYKEDDDVIGIPNGTVQSDHITSLNQSTPDTSLDLSNASTINSSSGDLDSSTEVKPKLREWEKHKAPWLAEMKLNQAKRTSTSPAPENRLKLSSTNANAEPEESKSAKNSPVSENKEYSPVNDNLMSKSMSVLPSATTKILKTPPNELEPKEVTSKPAPIVKAKPTLPPPVTTPPHKLATPLQPTKAPAPVPAANKIAADKDKPAHTKEMVPPSKISPVATNKTRVGGAEEHAGGGDGAGHAPKIEDVLERVRKLEEIVEKQGHVIEQLKHKLQLESDMRIMMQEKISRNEVNMQL